MRKIFILLLVITSLLMEGALAQNANLNNQIYSGVVEAEIIDKPFSNTWVLEDFGFGEISIHRIDPFKETKKFGGKLKGFEEVFDLDVCSKNSKVRVYEGRRNPDFLKNRSAFDLRSFNDCTTFDARDALTSDQPITFSLFYDRELVGYFAVSIDTKSESYLNFINYRKDYIEEKTKEYNFQYVIKPLLSILVFIVICAFLGFWIFKKLFKKGKEFKADFDKKCRVKKASKIVEKITIEEAIRTKLQNTDLDELQLLKNMITQAVQEEDYKKVERLTSIVNKLTSLDDK